MATLVTLEHEVTGSHGEVTGKARSRLHIITGWNEIPFSARRSSFYSRSQLLCQVGTSWNRTWPVAWRFKMLLEQPLEKLAAPSQNQAEYFKSYQVSNPIKTIFLTNGSLWFCDVRLETNVALFALWTCLFKKRWSHWLPPTFWTFNSTRFVPNS